MTSFLAELSRRDPVLWATGLVHLALAAAFVVGLAVVALMVWLPGGLLSVPEKIRFRKA